MACVWPLLMLFCFFFKVNSGHILKPIHSPFPIDVLLDVVHSILTGSPIPILFETRRLTVFLLYVCHCISPL